jgi:hypothetical protein
MKRVVVAGVLAVLLFLSLFAGVLALPSQAEGRVPVVASERGGEFDVQLRGLENAMTRVRSNESLERLSSVWEMVSSLERERLSLLSGRVVEVRDGDLLVRGEYVAEFAGFLPVRKQYRFSVLDDGSVVRERGLFDWAFRVPAEMGG